ncbi:PIN domain-containing protein [Bifidobacterium avesanii]|uniref:Ribonuclease VapC n=1 Tax=Bifidobacterium avesanii TaxID=1798157 RepID=A0A7K3TGC1_9BIFI|nr:PIN domain-containing protein [Bifidobacterium avesanii]
MMLLDTNVVSELMKPHADERVADWLVRRRDADLRLGAITVTELLYGARRLPEGRRRDRLTRAVMDVIDHYRERTLPFDDRAAAQCALILCDRESKGRPMELADAQIAAIAQVNGCALVTRNVRDFEFTSTDLINPWD